MGEGRPRPRQESTLALEVNGTSDAGRGVHGNELIADRSWRCTLGIALNPDVRCSRCRRPGGSEAGMVAQHVGFAPADPVVDVGQRVRSARLYRGMSIKTLAGLTGM